MIFFFQAEDGIRDYKVTGVQTCALPIYPETDRCQIQHDGVMNGDPETDRHQIEKNVQWLRHNAETGKRNDNYRATKRGIDYAIEPELFRRNGELAVDWQDQE